MGRLVVDGYEDTCLTHWYSTGAGDLDARVSVAGLCELALVARLLEELERALHVGLVLLPRVRLLVQEVVEAGVEAGRVVVVVAPAPEVGVRLVLESVSVFGFPVWKKNK